MSLYEKSFTLVLTCTEDGWVAKFGSYQTEKNKSPLRVLDIAVRKFLCNSCWGKGRGCQDCSGFGVKSIWRK